MNSNADSAKLNLEDKRQAFRVQIRRSAIDEMLKKRRVLIQQAAQVMQPEEQLLTAQQRDELVRSCTLAISGFPTQEWLSSLMQLRRHLPSFQGNFEALISNQIIYNLCQLFKPEYSAINWRNEVAQLLTDMICCNTSPGLVAKLIDYAFLKDICCILTNQQQVARITLLNNYLYLVGNIAGDSIRARNEVIQAGVPPIIKQLLDQAQDDYEVELLTWLVSNLVKSEDSGLNPPEKLRYNLVRYQIIQITIFLPALGKFIISTQPRILINILYSVVFMLTDSSYKLANIYHCHSIRNRLLELVNFPERTVRILSTQALGILCSSNNKHFATNLIQDRMLDCLHKSMTTYEQSRKEKLYFMWICQNIFKNANQDLFELVHHPCINKLFEYAHPTEQPALRLEALKTLNQLFIFATYNEVEYIFKVRTDFLEMMLHNLTNQNEPADVVLVTLKCLITLVKLYDHIYTPLAPNKIVYELERIRPIENIADELTHHANAQVQNAALDLCNLIGQCQSYD